MNKNNNNLCNFEKKYIEPISNYVVVSFSLFYIDEYIRHKRSSTNNISESRQLDFIYNMTCNINLLDLDIIPSNWYFRIYYDNSIFNFKYNNKYPWKDFFKKYIKHKRIQFVKFKCPSFMVENKHKNLFGTILRLYPLFCQDEKTSMIILFDCDNTFTQKYLDEIEKFRISDYDYNTFSSKYETSYYMYDFNEEDRHYYFRMASFASKVKYNIEYWNKILINISVYNDKTFESLVTFLYNLHLSVLPNKKIKGYKDFEYGMDEIILNYQIKNLFEKNKKKLRIVRYNPNPLMVYNTFEKYLKFNYKKNRDIVNKIVNNIAKKVTKKYKKDDLNFNLNKINKSLFSYINNTEFNFDILYKYYIHPVLENIDIVEKLIMPNNIIKFFKKSNINDYKYLDYNQYYHKLDFPKYLI
jgi:hypothetical protein